MQREAYRTVAGAAEAGLVVRRSRFIASVCPVTDEGEAQAFVASVKKARWDASHNVYAYILRQGQARRYSDDGEPQGTAGLPVLETLAGAELADCAAVVTRYFGGVLLGTGGLARAYAQAAAMAVEAACTVEMVRCALVRVDCDYSRYGKVSALVAERGGVLLDSRFAETVALEFLLPRELLPAFETALTDLSAGGLSAKMQGVRYHPF